LLLQIRDAVAPLGAGRVGRAAQREIGEHLCGERVDVRRKRCVEAGVKSAEASPLGDPGVPGTGTHVVRVSGLPPVEHCACICHGDGVIKYKDRRGDVRASLLDRHQGRRTVACTAGARELDGERSHDLDLPGNRSGQLRAGLLDNRAERQDSDTHTRQYLSYIEPVRRPTRLRIGDSEAEWQEYAGGIIETALDSASPSTKADIAPQLEELAEVAPRAAAPALSGLAYNAVLAWGVSQAAHKIPGIERVKTWERVDDIGQYDFALEATANRVILIEAKSSPRLSMSQVSEIMAKTQFYKETYPDRKVGLLLVSRYPLSAGIRAMFMQTPNAACVVVRSREDADALSAAINGVLSSLG
jgi:hypothetical protein